MFKVSLFLKGRKGLVLRKLIKLKLIISISFLLIFYNIFTKFAYSQISEQKVTKSFFIKAEIERDFDEFVSWLAGSWDNEIQSFHDNRANLPENELQSRSHVSYELYKNDQFPGMLFIVKNYGIKGIRGPIKKIDIHHYYPDIEQGLIVNEFLSYKNGDYSELAENPELLNLMDRKQFEINTECNVYWRKSASQFIGERKKGKCISRTEGSFNSKDFTGVLSPQDYWMRELLFDSKDNLLSLSLRFKEFKEVIYYSCYGRRQSSDGGWVMFQDIMLHNQGDFFWFANQELGIQLRRIIWRKGTFKNALALQSFQNGSSKMTVNAHASLNASFIGIDHPDFVVNCERP